MHETTRSCLKFDERPGTPPEIRKYRRSTNLEPGRRFQHYGVADDFDKMQLNDKIFGITDKHNKIQASDLISSSRPTELQKLNNLKAERVYKSVNREPLARSPERNVKLPSKFIEGYSISKVIVKQQF
jgi:hypothetical protein